MFKEIPDSPDFTGAPGQSYDSKTLSVPHLWDLSVSALSAETTPSSPLRENI